MNTGTNLKSIKKDILKYINSLNCTSDVFSLTKQLNVNKYNQIFQKITILFCVW